MAYMTYFSTSIIFFKISYIMADAVERTLDEFAKLLKTVFEEDNDLKGILRTVCRKDRLTVYKIKKIDFFKICQNKGLGKLVHKIYLSDRLEVYLFFDDFFSFCPWKPAKFTPKSALL